MPLKILSSVLLLLLACDPAWARRSRGRSKSYAAVDAGAHMNNLDSRASVSDANRGDAHTTSAFLRFRYGIPLSRVIVFEPSYGVVLPWRSGVDGSVIVFTSHLGLDFNFKIFNFLRTRLGPGIHWDWMQSGGGSAVLNNGNTTSEFYMPRGSSHVFLFTSELGLEFRIHKRWSLNFDFYVMTPLDSKRRNYKAAATIGYYL